MTLSQQLRELAGSASIGFDQYAAMHFEVDDWCTVHLNGCDEIADCRAGHDANENDQRANLIATFLNNLPTILTALELQERLDTERVSHKIDYIRKRSLILEGEENDLFQLKLNLGKIQGWALDIINALKGGAQ